MFVLQVTLADYLAILFRLFLSLVPKDIKSIWFSQSLAFSVPDEGYSRNASCALNLIFSFSFFCVVVLFLLAVVLSALPIMASDYPFDIIHFSSACYVIINPFHCLTLRKHKHKRDRINFK